MTKYVKRMKIEAVQWTGENEKELKAFLNPRKTGQTLSTVGFVAIITADNGERMTVRTGQYVVRGKDGFFAVDPQTFELLYMPAGGSAML